MVKRHVANEKSTCEGNEHAANLMDSQLSIMYSMLSEKTRADTIAVIRKFEAPARLEN